MSFTVNDALTSVAYRMGYDDVPTNNNEKSRWISQCDDAQRSILRKNLYWFTQDKKSLTSVSDQEKYDLDSTFREMIDVRLDGKIVSPITQHEQSVTYNTIYPAVSPRSLRYSLSYYIFGERELHIIPVTTSPPESQSISGITRSGSTVTVTTSAEHGYIVDDFVTIAGADQTDYNGAQQIYSVPSTTTFTFITTATPTTPATGTMTVIKRDIVYSFYKMPDRLTALTDTLLIPDLFFEGFVAYVKARLDLRDSERGSAADGFDEFNDIVEDMNVENNKRLFSNVNILSY
jgi:hypothetical protein